jgi:hypothetical protein
MNTCSARVNSGCPGVNSWHRRRRLHVAPSSVANERLFGDEHPCSTLLTLRETEEKIVHRVCDGTSRLCVDIDRTVNDHAVPIPDQFKSALPTGTDARWQLSRASRSCLARGGI